MKQVFLSAVVALACCTPAGSLASPALQNAGRAIYQQGLQSALGYTLVQNDTSLFSREIWREAQEALNFFGHEAGAPDGLPGRQTRAAIRSYQFANGEEPSGEFSRATMGLLLERYRQERAEASPAAAGEDAPASIADETDVPSMVVDEIESVASVCETTSADVLSNDGFLLTLDLNGDGVIDYIIDGARSGCMFTCGAANCSVTVFASNGAQSFRRSDFLAPGIAANTFVCASDGSCRFR